MGQRQYSYFKNIIKNLFNFTVLPILPIQKFGGIIPVFFIYKLLNLCVIRQKGSEHD